jgi:hypothetical protein
MWLIGILIYRGHHWMNTRGDALFALTCSFDSCRLDRLDAPAIKTTDLAVWMAVSFF